MHLGDVAGPEADARQALALRRKQLGRDNSDKRPRLVRLIDCRNVLRAEASIS